MKFSGWSLFFQGKRAYWLIVEEGMQSAMATGVWVTGHVTPAVRNTFFFFFKVLSISVVTRQLGILRDDAEMH